MQHLIYNLHVVKKGISEEELIKISYLNSLKNTVFQENLLKKEPFEVFQKNYEIHVKTELLDTINAYDFTDAQCKALYQERRRL